jgi:predicted dehydrogenase
VLDALDAGLHVLVEKPLCLAAADADRIVERQRETGLVVQVGYMKRFSPAYEALAADLAVAAPTLRLVSSLTVDPVLARDFAPPGHVTPAALPRHAAEVLDADTVDQVADGIGTDHPEHTRAFADAFLGALVHDVNLVQGLLGPVSGDVVDGFHEPAGRVAGGTVELASGGRWSLSWLLLDGAGSFSEDVRLLADEGEWRLRLPAPYVRPASGTFSCRRRARRGGWHTACDESYADPYARQLAHFHACVTGDAPPRNGPAEARDDIALLTRLFRAAIAAEVTA